MSPQMVISWPVYKLIEDGYSVPKDSYGWITEKKDADPEGKYNFIHWLPPMSGGSGPIPDTALEETGHAINIPYSTLEELGWSR